VDALKDCGQPSAIFLFMCLYFLYNPQHQRTIPNPLIITPLPTGETDKIAGIKIDNPTTQRVSNIKVELVELSWVNEN